MLEEFPIPHLLIQKKSGEISFETKRAKGFAK